MTDVTMPEPTADQATETSKDQKDVSVETASAEQIEILKGDEDAEDLDEEEQVEEEEPFVSIFEILDAPRELPEPIDLTLEHVKQIQHELGIITLCWPDVQNPEFERRVTFPESYVRNNEKEKLLLLYAENFRRQFSRHFPKRKPLYLASPNEVGLVVSTHIIIC